jgi:hypothetical protein
LKNRYNDVATNRKFVIGIDRAKMKLFDVDESQQQLIQGNAAEDQDDEDNGHAHGGGGAYRRTGGYGREKPAIKGWS